MKPLIGKKPIAEHENRKVEMPTGIFASELDLQIMAMVFKWKIVPMFALKAQLMRGVNEQAFIKRVYRLVRKGLLKKINHLGEIGLYQLTSAGFLRFKQELDGLKEEGFKSEAIAHDLLTMLFQLGPWVFGKPNAIDIVSEQELRRFYLKQLPRWIPDIGTHRPDGFSRFKNDFEKWTVAYEIELNSKQSDRYDSVFQYYSKQTDVDIVLWLVRNKGLQSLLTEKCKAIDSSSLGKHHFVQLEDFKSNFWKATTVSDRKAPEVFEKKMYSMCLGEAHAASNVCPDLGLTDFRKILSTY